MKRGGRKPGSRNVSNEVKSIIALAVLQNDKLPKLLSNKDLVKKLQETIGARNLPVPTKGTLKGEIAKARKQGPDPLGAPWSLGTNLSPAYPIPPEANEALLDVWSWCVAVGRTFTIREARWVAQLAGLSRFKSTLAVAALLETAAAYAIRERVCEILKKRERLYTADLDASLAFGRNLRLALSLIGHDADALGVDIQDWGRATVRAEAEDKAPSLTRPIHSNPAIVVEYSLGLQNLYDGRSLSIKARDDWKYGSVYAMWLRYFSEQPRWQDMSHRERERIHQHLWDEWKEAATQDDFTKAERGLSWRPSEILLEEISKGGQR